MVLRVTGEGTTFFKTLNTLGFGGEEDDVCEWTSRIDKYFSLRDVPEKQRLSMVFYHLEGDAFTWFQWLEMNCLLTTWSSFLINVKYRFGSSKFEESEGRILKLDQSGSAADYQFEMEEEYEKSQVKVQEDEREVNEVVVQETKEASVTVYFVKATEQPLCLENQDAKDAAETSEVSLEMQEAKDVPEISEVSQKIMPMYYSEKGTEVKGLVCEGLICHVNDTKAQVQNDKSTGVCEYVQFFHLSGKSEKGVIYQDGLWIDSSYKINKHLFGCIIADVARRRSILKFYALAEVYKEVLSLHLEDKVVFEESGNDTHGPIAGLGPITTSAQMSATHMRSPNASPISPLGLRNV